jgi:hypothetical protein
MKIKILINDIKNGFIKGDIVFVSKVKYIGDKQMWGVKSPKAGTGIIWFSNKEIEELI